MKSPLLFSALFLASASPAWAQNFGQDWLDDISRELQLNKGPLETKRSTTKITLGGAYSYDDNVFLDEKDEDATSILTAFGRVRGDVAEPLWDFSIDGMVSWTEYLASEAEDASDHQERVMVRGRYAGPVIDVQISDIFKNELDATDIVFADRIERVVNKTYLNTSVWVTPVFAFTADGAIEIVRFKDSPFDNSDNWNARGGAGVSWTLPYGIDLVAEAGFFHIEPESSKGPPETDGWFARGGFRGDITKTLKATVLAGATGAQSDDLPSGKDEEETTATAAVHFQWDATERVTVHADFARLITYTVGLGVDPFQTTNRFTTIGEVRPTDLLSFRGRFQYDDSESALGIDRDYLSVGGRAIYIAREGVALSLDATWRTGEIGSQLDFDNFILSAGMVLSN